MTPQRFHRVSELYHAALDRPADQRAAFLEQVCSGDMELRQEVQSLLDANAQAGDFMTAPDVAAPDEATPDAAMDTQLMGATGALIPGSILGSYEILSPLGAGGSFFSRSRCACTSLDARPRCCN